MIAMPALIESLTGTAERDGVVQLVVGAVILHDDRVLLLRRSRDDFMGGIWELPSGKVEHGEKLDAALVREVAEETGLTVSAIGRYLDSFDYMSGSGKLSRQFNFVVECAVTEPVHLTEHDTYAWVSLKDELPVTEAVKATLAAFQPN